MKKWTRNEFLICRGFADEIEVEKVKGITTSLAEYSVGIYKNENGLWMLVDINTGCQILHQKIWKVDNTQKALKAFVEEYEDDLVALLDKAYENEIRIEKLKSYLGNFKG